MASSLPGGQPSTDLHGRAALVTGASTGIGRATAVALARHGARVAINYPDASEEANARETLRRVREAAPAAAVPAGPVFSSNGTTDGIADGIADGTAEALPPGLLVRADVRATDAVQAMFDEVAATYGPLDLLVNNAGIQLEAPSHEVTPEAFDRVIDVNLRGAFFVAQAALRQFLNAEKPGVIVNLSSVHERIPRPQYASYAMSKSAVGAMTRTLALEYAARDIRVNAVAPGATRTPIQSWLGDEDAAAVVRSHIPNRRIAEPEDVAHAVLYLASDPARYVTGETLYIDGGLSLYPDFQKPWSG